MVDAIGNKASAVGDRRVAPVDAARHVSAARGVADETPELRSAATAMAGTAAARPPVDTDRVTQLRDAIASGRYPIDPNKIAARMLAAKQEWDAHGPA